MTRISSSMSSGNVMQHNTGSVAAGAWLMALDLSPSPARWYAEIAMNVRDTAATFVVDDRADTYFRIDVYAEEWGFYFCHRDKASWIPVTDIAFVHGQDDFQLLRATPRLDKIGTLVQELEHRHDLRFRLDLAAIRSNVANAELAIRRWVSSL